MSLFSHLPSFSKLDLLLGLSGSLFIAYLTLFGWRIFFKPTAPLSPPLDQASTYRLCWIKNQEHWRLTSLSSQKNSLDLPSFLPGRDYLSPIPEVQPTILSQLLVSAMQRNGLLEDLDSDRLIQLLQLEIDEKPLFQKSQLQTTH